MIDFRGAAAAAALATLTASGVALAPGVSAAPTSSSVTDAQVFFTAGTGFEGNSGIYQTPASDVWLPAGSTVLAPTSTLNVQRAKVSPDGTKVAAVLSTNASSDPVNPGTYELDVIDLHDGSRVTLATDTSTPPPSGFGQNDEQYVGDFTWTPDSSTVVFAWVALTSGVVTSQLQQASATGRPAVVVVGSEGLEDPAIDPQDATKLAALRLDGGQSPPQSLVTADYNAATPAVTNVTTLASVPSGQGLRNTSWSQDGSTIAVNHASAVNSIDVIQPFATTPQLQTAIQGAGETNGLCKQYVQPAWAPDGSLWATGTDSCGDSAFLNYLVNATESNGTWSAPTVRSSDELRVGYGTASASFPLASATTPAGRIGPGDALWRPATLGGARVSLHWINPTDAAFNHVVVTRDGTQVYSGTASSLTDSGLTVGRTYTYAITAYDADGHPQGATASNPAGDPANTHNVVAANKPTLTVTTPTSTVSESLLFPITGHGAPVPGYAENGRGLYLLSGYQRLTNGQLVAASNMGGAIIASHGPIDSASTGTRAGVASATYYVRATVRDAYDNSATGPLVAANVPYNQSAASHSSGWTTANSNSYWLHDAYSTTRSGSSITIHMTARTFGVIAAKCSTCGSFVVYLDGHRIGTVSTANSTTRYRQVVWAHRYASIGTHTLEIVASLSRGKKLLIDGFEDAR